MDILDLLKESCRNLHTSYDEAVQDLSVEQLHWRPENKGNHIAFTAWHYVRTEDNVVRFVLQNRRPTVWLDGGWDQKFGLDRIAQGTGMPPEEAAALRLPSAGDWMPYQQAVWRACEEYLASIKESDLENQVRVAQFGELPVRRVLMTILVTHGFTHLGEMHHLRSLQGLRTTI
jgi:hypothetical protein